MSQSLWVFLSFLFYWLKLDRYQLFSPVSLDFVCFSGVFFALCSSDTKQEGKKLSKLGWDQPAERHREHINFLLSRFQRKRYSKQLGGPGCRYRRWFLSLCLAGVLKLLPNRSQFFLYESLNLTCERQGDSSGWTLERNTHKYVDRETFNLKATDKSWCFFDVLYSSDSGEYWCESAAGEYSDFINITVISKFERSSQQLLGGHHVWINTLFCPSGHNVILESPALPVTEGDDVTLRCRTANMFSSPTVDFYKDGVLFRNSSTGNMTLHKVLAADGGVYSCNIPGGGESAQSRLTIRGEISPHVSAFTSVWLRFPIVNGTFF